MTLLLTVSSTSHTPIDADFFSDAAIHSKLCVGSGHDCKIRYVPGALGCFIQLFVMNLSTSITHNIRCYYNYGAHLPFASIALSRRSLMAEALSFASSSDRVSMRAMASRNCTCGEHNGQSAWDRNVAICQVALKRAMVYTPHPSRQSNKACTSY